MSQNNQNNPSDNASFFARVIANDAFRKGMAGAVAGALVSVVSEVLWPSSR